MCQRYTAVMADDDDAPQTPHVQRPADSAPNPLLQRLFESGWRAGQAPEALRAWLDVPGWQPIAAPAEFDLAACVHASAWRIPMGKSAPLRPLATWRVRHWGPAGVAEDVLSLDDAQPVDVNVFHLPAGAWACVRAQWAELQRWRAHERDQRAYQGARQRQIDVLGGGGTLADLLALTVWVDDAALPTRAHRQLQVVPIYSETASGLHAMPLGDLLAALAMRTDYDGIVVNPDPYLQRVISPLKEVYWGPLFAARALAGADERGAHCRVSEGLQRLHDAERYHLPRYGAKVDLVARRIADECLALAEHLLQELPSDQPAWLRADLRSAAGAALLRQQPALGGRPYLVQMAARCRRVARTRWRYGLY